MEKKDIKDKAQKYLELGIKKGLTGRELIRWSERKLLKWVKKNKRVQQ